MRGWDMRGGVVRGGVVRGGVVRGCTARDCVHLKPCCFGGFRDIFVVTSRDCVHLVFRHTFTPLVDRVNFVEIYHCVDRCVERCGDVVRGVVMCGDVVMC